MRPWNKYGESSVNGLINWWTPQSGKNAFQQQKSLIAESQRQYWVIFRQMQTMCCGFKGCLCSRHQWITSVWKRADIKIFLVATKQLYEWFSPSVRLSVRPSIRPSVRPSHLFDYVPIIISSWNLQELLSVTEVTSMQKVKVRGQRLRSRRSQPNLTPSGL